MAPLLCGPIVSFQPSYSVILRTNTRKNVPAAYPLTPLKKSPFSEARLGTFGSMEPRQDYARKKTGPHLNEPGLNH